jgi:hypothetical protein
MQKKFLFRIQRHNVVFPLFNHFVKNIKNSIFFTIFRLFFDQKHSKTFKNRQKSCQLDKGFQMVYELKGIHKNYFFDFFDRHAIYIEII